MAFEESARASRRLLRGFHRPCHCGGLEIERDPLGGSSVGIAVEGWNESSRQLSENRKTTRVL